MVTDPALLSASLDAVLSVYRGPQEIAADVSFGRQLGSELPSGSYQTVGPSSDSCRPHMLTLPAAAGTDRVGVFFFEAITFDRTIRIQTVVLSEQGKRSRTCRVNLITRKQTDQNS